MNQPPLNPDALEAAARALLAMQQPEVSADYAWNVQFDDGREELRKEAAAAVSVYLAAALPEVISDAYTVAIRNTEKSTGRVSFDYPGCTPEIGTLDDARELLSWVSEGMRESPDSPYSSEVRIYKLTEVNDA